MRRAATILPALALTACLTLVGCSDSSGGASASASAEATVTPLSSVDCSTLTIDDDSDSLPTLEGEAGSEPTITWGDGDAPANLTVKTLDAGDGAEVTEAPSSSPTTPAGSGAPPRPSTPPMRGERRRRSACRGSSPAGVAG
nr:hypothetical protein [Actinomyces ruminis]